MKVMISVISMRTSCARRVVLAQTAKAWMASGLSFGEAVGFPKNLGVPL